MVVVKALDGFNCFLLTGIGRLLPKMYVHWMVKDVPANNIKNGVEGMQYVTPFSLEFNEAGELVTDAAESSHPLIMAVFKQEAGKIVVEEAQQGCGPDIGPEGAGVLHSHWSRSVQILCSYWLNLTMLVPRSMP